MEPVRSLDDFKRRFFPTAYENEKTEKGGRQERYGLRLADALLLGIRQAMVKK
jgi:hypothetical protein